MKLKLHSWRFNYLIPGHLNCSCNTDNKTAYHSRGGHWGLRYCGISQFFMRYFGNFNLKLRYCGIHKTCGIRILAFWLVLKIVVP